MSGRNRIVCDGNINPAVMDVDDKPRRRRKAVTREREPLPEVMRPWVAAAYERKKGRPVPPGAMFEVEGVGDKARIRLVGPFHFDKEWDWESMIADTFGTRSWSVMMTFLDHLSNLDREAWDSTNQIWKPDEQSMNAALAIVYSSRPQNEIDAMLCAQAVALHWLQMRAASSTLSNSWINDRTAATCAKLTRAFVNVVEAMDRRKRKPRTVRQLITVKRENHYHEHKHVHLAPPPIEGGAANFGGRGHAADLQSQHAGTHSIEKCATVSCKNQEREQLSIARSTGEEPLPNARGARGSGGQKGEANGGWKHGAWTGEAVQFRREASALLKAVRGGAGQTDPTK